jgi:hypothetical protein
MTIESPTDGDVFLAYLEQVLCPQLQPGQVVIMDNLAAHKVDGVRSLIQACGAELLYTAALLTRLQPHRASLVQDQRNLACRQSPLVGHPWKRPSLKLLLPSPPTMLSLGSATAATGYTNYETALSQSERVARNYPTIERRRRGSYVMGGYVMGGYMMGGNVETINQDTP